MKNGETRKFKSGIEIYRDKDAQGQRRYTAIDPKGYLGRMKICDHWDYLDVLRDIREYIKNNK